MKKVVTGKSLSRIIFTKKEGVKYMTFSIIFSIFYHSNFSNYFNYSFLMIIIIKINNGLELKVRYVTYRDW